METFVLIAVLIGLFLTTTPIGMSFIASTIILLLLFTNIPVMLVASGLFSKLDSFPLQAILFFILLGNLMKEGKCAQYLVDFTKALIIKIPGGLGIAGVVACAIFGAISGSATATVVAIATMMVPAMVLAEYDKSFSVGLLTTASILGVIIPPSILMILYSVVANVSVGKLFLGGIAPGILIAIGLSVYTSVVSMKNKYGVRSVSAKSQEGRNHLFEVTQKAIWALALPVLILGGIYGGVFTPTEAAVVGCAYALIVESCIYRSLKIKAFLEIFKVSGISTGALLITLAGASVFADYITMKQIPQDISSFVVDTIQSPVVFLICINLLFLFLGTFIDPLTAIIVVTPLLLPTVLALQIDPIFLGVILAINLGIGYCTPPMGANLFVASMVMKESYSRVTVAVLPPISICLIILILLNAFPSIILFLPNLLM